MLLGLLALVLLGGLAIAGFSGAFGGGDNAAVDVSEQFLDEVDAGNYGAAANFFDSGCSSLTQSDLQGFFNNADIEYDLDRSSVSGTSALVKGDLTIDGVEQTVTLELRQSGDEWGICDVLTE